MVAAPGAVSTISACCDAAFVARAGAIPVGVSG